MTEAVGPGAMTSDLPLGRHVEYPRHYDASLLFPIPRAHGRAELGLPDTDALPFTGADRWHAYEVSWLDARGKPVVATLTVSVPETTPECARASGLRLLATALIVRVVSLSQFDRSTPTF